jgi:hypothetical protein
VTMCYAEVGGGEAVGLEPKLLPDDDGPACFRVTAPTREGYDGKQTWVGQHLDKFFGAGTGQTWVRGMTPLASDSSPASNSDSSPDSKHACCSCS